MMRVMLVLGGLCAAFLGADAGLGYGRAYAIGYGAFTFMALMVAVTFFWLWRRRATPLAMGMFFGWAGAAGVMGWWWSYSLFEAPGWMVESPVLFLFLSLYFMGALLHFQVIWHSFGGRGVGFLWPVGLSLAASVLLQAVF
ncbi:MAG: hypothetical protein OIF48_14655 [Silicimonas sp.]|nr:hypothetical protein [Silicimonas sp.]